MGSYNFEEGHAGDIIPGAGGSTLNGWLFTVGDSSFIYDSHPHSGLLAGLLNPANAAGFFRTDYYVQQSITSAQAWVRPRNFVASGSDVYFGIQLYLANPDYTDASGGAVGGEVIFNPDRTSTFFGAFNGFGPETTTYLDLDPARWWLLSVSTTGSVKLSDDSGASVSSHAIIPMRKPGETLDLLPVASNTAAGYIDDFAWSGGHAIRKWPRDDGLGYSSAARIHPPPKSGRVVGGYQ